MSRILVLLLSFLLSGRSISAEGEMQLAVSTKAEMTAESMGCLHNSANRFIGYITDEHGRFDDVGLQNVRAAIKEGFTLVDGAFSPCVRTDCTAPIVQIKNAIELLNFNNSVQLSTLWIIIEDTDEWETVPAFNRDQIITVEHIAEATGVQVGIASNRDVFDKLFGPNFAPFSKLPLWWTTLDSSVDFSGYNKSTEFGDWSAPAMHIYNSSVECPCKSGCQPSAKATFTFHYYCSTNGGCKKTPYDATSLIKWIGGGIGLALIIAVVSGICIWKRKKLEEKFRRQIEMLRLSRPVADPESGAASTEYSKEPTDEWELDRFVIQVNHDVKLGNGAFGYVYTANLLMDKADLNKINSPRDARLLRHAGETVAVKLLPDSADSNSRQDFVAEISTMKELKYHERIVNLIACVTLSEPAWLVMEFCPNGDLRKFLLSKKQFLDEQMAMGKELTEIHELISLKEQLMFALQIATGLEYLSQRGYVHRDIAARNILLDQNNACKIGDFGLCRRVEQAHDNYMSRGGRLPIKWMSPEAIIQFLFSTKSDVWSYGVVLFEIMTLAAPPYPSWPAAEVLDRLNQKERMKKPEACPGEIFDIMSQCWRHHPAERPDFTQIRDGIAALLTEASDDNYYLQLISGENYYALHRPKLSEDELEMVE